MQRNETGQTVNLNLKDKKKDGFWVTHRHENTQNPLIPSTRKFNVNQKRPVAVIARGLALDRLGCNGLKANRSQTQEVFQKKMNLENPNVFYGKLAPPLRIADDRYTPMDAPEFHVVFVTAPDLETARRLASAALEAHAAACANLISGLESHYWWQGKLECGIEVLVMFKTMRSQIETLRELVLKTHPYTTPEFIALPISHGTPDYLGWIRQNVRPTE